MEISKSTKGAPLWTWSIKYIVKGCFQPNEAEKMIKIQWKINDLYFSLGLIWKKMILNIFLIKIEKFLKTKWFSKMFCDIMVFIKWLHQMIKHFLNKKVPWFLCYGLFWLSPLIPFVVWWGDRANINWFITQDGAGSLQIKERFVFEYLWVMYVSCFTLVDRWEFNVHVKSRTFLCIIA